MAEHVLIVKNGVVIVTYHSFERIIRYVREELPKMGDDLVAVIVDNDADVGSSRRLADACGAVFVPDAEAEVPRDARLFLLNFKENLGYGRGNNRGASFLSRNFRVRYLLFSNDDIEVESPDILAELCRPMLQDRQIKVTGPQIVGLDGAQQSPHWKPISLYREIGWSLLGFLRKKRKNTSVVPTLHAGICYWVSGAFMLAETDAFLDAGQFDEKVFLYNEEKILSERLARRGWKCCWQPAGKVLHYEGASTQPSVDKRRLLLASSCHYYRHYRGYSAAAVWIYRISCRLGRWLKWRNS